jgi:hypothetical protein
MIGRHAERGVTLFVLLSVLAVVLCVVLGAAFGRELYPGQYAQYSDQQRAWFKSIRSPGGVPCCDVADGHLTEWRQTSAGYMVPIGGEWRLVPAAAVVYNAGNPVGEAIVWYRDYGPQIDDPDRYLIRCFVPNSEG